MILFRFLSVSVDQEHGSLCDLVVIVMSAGVATAQYKSTDGQLGQQDEVAEQMQVDAVVTEADEDLYTKLKTLQKQLEFLEIQVCSSLL